jgi:hypothetical protein
LKSLSGKEKLIRLWNSLKLYNSTPDFPKEAVDYYDKTISLLKNLIRMVIQFNIFHNYIKVTLLYQSGIMDLKGPEDQIGFPLITFDQQLTSQIRK